MYTTSDSTQASDGKPLSSYTLRRYPWRPYVVPFDDIVGKKYPGSGTNEDPYIVDWLPNDKEDPQQWPGTYKWFTVSYASGTHDSLLTSIYRSSLPV